eukprot:SAG22_NODE_4751_length_1174_cov_2.093023_2_plen_76_part_00
MFHIRAANSFTSSGSPSRVLCAGDAGLLDEPVDGDEDRAGRRVRDAALAVSALDGAVTLLAGTSGLGTQAGCSTL